MLCTGEMLLLFDQDMRVRRKLIDFTEAKLSVVETFEDIVETVRSGARTALSADGVTFVLRDNGFCHYVEEDAIGPLWKGQRFPMDTCISG